MIRVDNMIGWIGWKALAVLFFLLFALLFIRNAWVVDDAYITFRTVDNLLEGHGLTWNVDERVQVYTHPMWMFLVSVVTGLFGNIFFSALGLSFALSAGTLIVAWSYLRGRGEWRVCLLMLLVMSSKAIMDYTSSGLENPLSYMLAALFFAEYLFRGAAGERSRRGIFFLFFVASLAFFNRCDTVIVYLPALLHVLAANATRYGLRLVPLLLLATLPATLWELFSILYYGFPFPNTAYAKVLSADFPLAHKWNLGIKYLRCSISTDALAFIVLLLAVVLAARRKQITALASLAGVLLYGLYVVAAAASATHMAGRFFALPLMVGLLIFVHLLERKQDLAFILVLAVAFVVWNPMAPSKMGTKKYKYKKVSPSCVDTCWHVHAEGMALLPFEKQPSLPFHDWMEDGKTFSRKTERIHLGGALGGEAIGYFGYAAGHRKFIIDYLGLSDPLLARLPPIYTKVLKAGHHYRFVPRGYIASLPGGKNRIKHPDLREYYDHLRVITRGDLFSLDRLGRIIRINTGGYDSLLRRYLASKEYRTAARECSSPKKKEWWHFLKNCLHSEGRYIR